ncbi:glutamyl-tRNA reductase [Candidatus Omnitrophota bacterium]
MERIKEYHFFLTGISHKTADVELREKVSFSPDKIADALSGVRSIRGVSECVILSTCNRTELYTVLTKPSEKLFGAIEQFIQEFSGVGEDISGFFYRFHDSDVIEHLFRVCCGLDSMILGEPQIFGQVKNAYSAAIDYKCTGTATNRLFHHAFQVGKLIRNSTSIGKGAVSISYAAVELARKIFCNLDGLSALLVGTGKIGEICARQLIKSGIEHLYIANRTSFRAEDLADKLAVKTIPFETIPEMGNRADIIITSVASDKPILKTSDFLSPAVNRKGARIVIIDLGVPRNIESDTPGTESIVLYNIDDLEEVVYDNRDKRKSEVKKAEKLIREEVDDYCIWLVERDVIPVITSLRKTCEKIRKTELKKIKNRIDAETYETLDLLTERIVRKLLHNPTITIRAAASNSSRKRLIETVKELFIESYKL